MRFFFLMWMVWGISGQGNAQKFTLSGFIGSTHFHQGGIERSYEPLMETAKPNFMVYLIGFSEKDSLGHMVCRITTDKEGRFSVRVKPGKYGFILPDELDSLKPGQFLPASLQTGDLFNSEFSFWELTHSLETLRGPLLIEDEDVHVRLMHHSRSICGTCP